MRAPMTRCAALFAVCVPFFLHAPVLASQGSDVEAFTGGVPMKCTWIRGPYGDGFFGPNAGSTTWEVMVLDTQEGTERVVWTGAPFEPVITRDGWRVFWTDIGNASDRKVMVANCDGSGTPVQLTFPGSSALMQVLDTFGDYVYIAEGQGTDNYLQMVRYNISGTTLSARQVVYDMTEMNYPVSIADDGIHASGGWPWNMYTGISNIQTGVRGWTSNDTGATNGGCNPALRADGAQFSYIHYDSAHRRIRMFDVSNWVCSNERQIDVITPAGDGQVWGTRWPVASSWDAAYGSFMVMSAPHPNASLSNGDIWLAKFNAGITAVDSWQRVSSASADKVDTLPFAWMGVATNQAPAIVSTAPAEAYVGVEYSYALSATGYPSPTYAVSGEPSWLTLTGNTLSGTPDAADAGMTGTITVAATNAQGVDSQTFQIEVVLGDASLVGYWSFDEQAAPGTDGSIYGNDGTLVGGAAWTASGHSGGAVDFTGAGCVSVPDSASISLSGDVTIAAWFRLPALEDGVFNIVGKDFNDAYRLRLGVNQGTNFCGFEFFTNDGGGPEGGWYSCPALLIANTWYHVAASFDSSTGDKRFHIDGVYGGSLQTTGRSITNTAGALALGAGNTGFSEGWKGLLDEVRLYNRVLSDQEVTDLFNGTISAMPTITSTPVTSVRAEASYSYTVVATGDPAPTITVSGEPAWLTLTGNVLAGTPSASDIGASGTITVTATNVAGNDTQTFTITVSAAQSITVERPESGDVWYVGTQPTIEWSVNDITNVVILYSINGGTDWAELPGAGTIQATSPLWAAFPWTIPDTPSVDCRVRIREYFNAAVDTSPTFEIRTVVDNDSDGMDDTWETDNFTDDTRDGSDDFDGDGITDAEEFDAATDPTDPLDPTPEPVAPTVSGSSGPSCAAGPGTGDGASCAVILLVALIVLHRPRFAPARAPLSDNCD